MTNVGKEFKSKKHYGLRPDLHPNGRIVTCVKDNDNDYLVVTSNENTKPNTWLTNIKYLKD